MDALVPGFGVRVTDRADEKGRAAQRTFILLTRYPGTPNPARRALGDYGGLTLDAARAEARHWIGLLQQGLDPSEHEEASRLLERDRRANTFGAIAEDFIREHLCLQRRAIPLRTRDSQGTCFSLARWPIGSLTRRDVVELVDTIKSRVLNGRRITSLATQGRSIIGQSTRVYGLALEQSPFNRLRPTRLIGPKKFVNVF